MPLLSSRQIAAGDPVFLENEPSDEVCFVHSGEVEILGRAAHQNKVLSRLKVFGPGEQFSEFSVLANTPHSTSAFALTDCEILTLDAASFKKVLHALPRAAENLARRLGSIHQSALRARQPIPYFQESLYLFSPDFQRLIPFDQIKSAGVIPLRSMHGSLTVAMVNPVNPSFFEDFRKHNPSTQLEVQFISEADFQRMIGKLAIAYATPAESAPSDTAASPKGGASTSSMPAQGGGGLEAFLKRNRLFSHLSDAALARVLPCFSLRQLGPDSTLYSPGEESREFFVIHSGQVALTKPADSGTIHQVATLGPGDSFAELSLLSGSKHTLRASSVGACQVYVLGAESFRKLLADPEFSISISTHLAVRLQEINRHAHFKFNPSQLSRLAKYAQVLRRDLIDQHKVVPLAMDASGVVIGAVNLDDPGVYTAVSRALPGHPISFTHLSDEEFDLCHLALFASPAPSSGVASSNAAASPVEPKAQLDLLVGLARELGCQELRIEPFGSQYRFRFRIKGAWQEKAERVPLDVGAKMIARAKSLAQGNRGELKSEINKAPVSSLTTFCTVRGGEVLTLQIRADASSTPSSMTTVPFQILVPERKTYSRLRDSLKRRSGALLFAGPAMSGKSTSLQSAAEVLSGEGRTVVALDPSFAGGPGTLTLDRPAADADPYRAAIALKPDALVFPKLDDAKTASDAFDAASRGILVLAEIEAAGSFAALARLRKLGVHDQTLAEFLIGVSSQVLVPESCAICRTQTTLGWSDRNRISRFLGGQPSPEQLGSSPGCPSCGGSGTGDLIAFFEYWRVTPAVQNAVARGAAADELRAIAKLDGFWTLGEFGIRMALNGLTSLAILDRYLPGWDQQICAPAPAPVPPSAIKAA